MLALSNYRVFQTALSKHGILPNISVQCLRSLSTTQQEDQLKDVPIKMENPYKEPQKGCILCNVPVDYKNVQLLSQFISPHTGRIYGRHITGLCGHKQREVTKAIKRARSMEGTLLERTDVRRSGGAGQFWHNTSILLFLTGFMSVTLKDPQFIKDPNICDIRHME